MKKLAVHGDTLVDTKGRKEIKGSLLYKFVVTGLGKNYLPERRWNQPSWITTLPDFN